VGKVPVEKVALPALALFRLPGGKQGEVSHARREDRRTAVAGTAVGTGVVLFRRLWRIRICGAVAAGTMVFGRRAEVRQCRRFRGTGQLILQAGTKPGKQQ
jgi:hypothetical protein